MKHTPQSRVATVISFIQRRFLCKPVAPKVKYVTNFSDGRTGEVLDILPFKTTKKLAKYFNDNFTLEERSKVRFLCCDMGKAYLNLAKHCFPNAVVCLDNFHVTYRLNEAMDAARIKEQDRLLF